MRAAPFIAIVAALVLAVTGCSKERRDKGTGGGAVRATKVNRMLELIPADTPYAFVSLQPMPTEYVEAIFGSFGPMFDQTIGAVEKELRNQPDSQRDDPSRFVLAAIDELKGKFNRQGLAELGLSTETHAAIYGIGVLPALRIELKDPASLRAVIARIEKRSGVTLPQRTLAGQTYWAAEEDGALFVAAVAGQDLVLGVAPSAVASDYLPLLFGQKKPAQSLARNTLERIATDYGFRKESVGFLDLERLVAGLLGEGGPVNAAIARLLDAQSLSPECRGEIKGLVRWVPRMYAGYAEISPKKMVSAIYFELRPEVRMALAGLAAGVPGLEPTVTGQPLFVMGAGVDVGRTIGVLRTWAAAVKASPYRCQDLSDLNDMAAELARALDQPLPPGVAELKGASLVLEDFKMAGQMPDAKGVAIVATSRPEALLTMAQLALPTLAQLPIKPDGNPVAVPPSSAIPVQGLAVALKADAIGVSMGAGQDASLKATIARRPPADPPLFVLGYHQGRFARLMRDLSPPGSQFGLFQAQEGLGMTTMAVHVEKRGLVMRVVQTLP